MGMEVWNFAHPNQPLDFFAKAHTLNNFLGIFWTLLLTYFFTKAHTFRVERKENIPENYVYAEESKTKMQFLATNLDYQIGDLNKGNCPKRPKLAVKTEYVFDDIYDRYNFEKPPSNFPNLKHTEEILTALQTNNIIIIQGS